MRHLRTGTQLPRSQPLLPDVALAWDGVVVLVESKNQGGTAALRQRACAIAGAGERVRKPPNWRATYETVRSAA